MNRKNWVRWFKKIVMIGVLIGCVGGIAALCLNAYIKSYAKDYILTVEEAKKQEPFDCILVLGCGVWDDNVPSPMLADRLARSVELYEAGVSDRLLMSGDHGRETYDEVNVMKDYAIEKGVLSEHIFMDHAGFSTYESMYRAKDIFQVKRVLIVTQEYHMYRAVYVARQLGLDAYGTSADQRQYAGDTYREFREILARNKDFVTVLLHQKPTYLGEVIPISGDGNATNDRENPAESKEPTESEPSAADMEPGISAEESIRSASNPAPEETGMICPDGMTLETRFAVPKGYTRLEAAETSLLAFMRQMELKPDGSPVLLYDGTEKKNQKSHAAVFALDVGNRDLQQCADSILRVYGEYLWSRGEKDQIGFHLTSGFWMDYASWREGNRLVLNGNDVMWNLSASYDDSYESFRSYMTQVFVYAGTMSLDADSAEVSMEEAMPGDMFLKGGSPGHCVLIVDMAVNELGEKCFLLAQGYMPAQEFHVLVNNRHPEDPWYYESEVTYPFRTPEYTFPEGSLQRYSYCSQSIGL